MLGKAIETLQGSTIKAAEVLREELDHPDEKIRQKAATEILDRAIGKPVQVEQTYIEKPILNFQLIGVSQDKIDALFKPKVNE